MFLFWNYEVTKKIKYKAMKNVFFFKINETEFNTAGTMQIQLTKTLD